VAERELAILLTARDRASRVVTGLDKKLDRLGRAGGRVFSGLRTGATRAGLAIGTVLVGGVALGVRSLDELYRVQNQTNAVIESTGGVAGVTGDTVRRLSNDLESLTTADDKAIQAGANVILRYTRIGKEVFPRATKAATDMAIALAGGDVEAANFAGAAQLVGRALDDPVKGMARLRRQGVTFTKEQEKQVTTLVKAGRAQEAQIVILRELEKRYGKAGEAAGKGPGAAWRRLQDTGEELSQALARGVLPALVKVSEWVNTKLADPRVTAELESIGEALGTMVEKGLAFVDKVDFKAVFAGIGVARDAAKTILSTFLALPPWVQTAVVTGWGLNRLTGGAVSGIVGELGKGLIRGVLGMNAGVVNLNAGVVNGAGGVPGVAGGPGVGGFGGRLGILNNPLLRTAGLLGGGMLVAGSNAGTGGVAGTAGNVAGGALAGAGVAGPIGAIAGALGGLVKSASEQQSAGTAAMATGIRDGLNSSIAGKTFPELRTALAGVEQGIRDIRATPLATVLHGDALAQLEGMRSDLQRQLSREDAAALAAQRAGERSASESGRVQAELRQLKAAENATALAAQRAGERSAGAIASVAAAVRSINFSPRIVVPVTVPAPRVAISLTERGRTRYYAYGNGGPVRSRVDL